MGLRKARMGGRNVGMHYRIIPGPWKRLHQGKPGSHGMLWARKGDTWATHLAGEGCSESELWELPGGFWLLRFIQAFSLGGGAGITFGLSSRDLGGGEGGSSSFPRGSFSRDFSLSLLRVAGGTQIRVGAAPQPRLGRSSPPDPNSLRPVGPEPTNVPGGPAGPLWEDSLPVRDRSWFSSLRQLGCLG